MTPAFDIEGGLPLALARAASVIGLALAGGGLFYAAAIQPPGLCAQTDARVWRLNAAALILAGATALLWLLAQGWDFASDMQPASIWATLSATVFGHLLAARVLLLALAAACHWRAWRRGAAGLALVALALQGGHSHAIAMGVPPWLIAASFLHVLAGGIWLGALPAFWLVLRGGPPADAIIAARRFSVAGLACVAVLLITASVQFHLLVVDLPGLLGTAYGWVVCVKICLLAALLTIAAGNRRRLSTRQRSKSFLLLFLEKEDLAFPTYLRRAVLAEISLGIAVICAAGVLTELQPAMHVQKFWPFGWLPSLEAAREDPDILREVLWGGFLSALGSACLIGGALRRRPVGLAIALGGLGFLIAGTGHLSPLLVQAEPTIFYRSPTGFTAAAIVEGATLYPANCAACHGLQGNGDGKLATTLPIPAANLNAAHLWMHPDGELFWWLTQGIQAPRGGLAMPGFPQLDDNARWALIDFVRARNAGLTLAAPGIWGTPVQAPDIAIVCGPGRSSLSALRGRAVRLVLGSGPTAPPAPGVADVTRTGACHVADDAAMAAYAIAAPGAKAMLIDANGWLRRAAPDAAALGAPSALLPANPAPMAMDMKM